MRLSRATATAAAVAALALALTACGDDEADTTSPPKKTATATSTEGTGAAPTDGPTATPTDGVDALDSLFADGKQAAPTGEAADLFGADLVAGAYEQLVKFSLREGYDETLMRTEKPTLAMFTPVTDHMTETGKATFEDVLEQAFEGDQEALGAINLLAFYDITADSPYVLPPGGEPILSNLQFSPATTAVDATTGRDRLAISFTTSADLSLLSDGKPVTLRMTKDHTFWVVPTGTPEQPVLIDFWEGSYTPEVIPAG